MQKSRLSSLLPLLILLVVIITGTVYKITAKKKDAETTKIDENPSVVMKKITAITAAISYQDRIYH